MVLGCVTAAAAWSPAHADASPGHCTSDSGVTVVVDFQELGGGTVVRCVDQVPAGTTGLQALRLAGFTHSGTIHDGPGFVCRIDDRPAATETLPVAGNEEYRETCVATPPKNAFWGYWHAPNGGEWTFSSFGGGARTVIPGGYEGWSFSLNRGTDSNPAPRVAPSHPVAPPATEPPAPPTTTTPPAPAPRPTTAAPGSTARPPANTATPASPPSSEPTTPDPAPEPARTAPIEAPSASPSPPAQPPISPSVDAPSPTTADSSPSTTAATGPAASPPPPRPSPGRSVPPGASLPPTTPAVVEAEPAAGPPLGTLIGVGAVVVLGAAGGATWWRRRGLG
ncbi:hypothetical protein RPIT_08505 [Tessaracoccus flavus]|uniref:Uncharacterized protein n=1 Tax=Tessaracoccus flavus TaxID=1610493 RepID=A0A1Q2CJ64_9ACTN|nr:hypothetical protein RPIT_08505 [Tessaracoccus flavus]